MSKRKTGLTIAEHRQAASKIRRASQAMNELRVLLGQRYSLKMSDKYYHLQCKFFETLRCELDSCGFAEHRDDFTTQVYYGPDCEREPGPSENEQLHLKLMATIADNAQWQTRAREYRKEIEANHVVAVAKLKDEQAQEVRELRARIEGAVAVLDPDDIF